MMKLLRSIAIFIALTMLLSGCWSLTEINDNALVTIVFLDKGKDGNIELSLGFPLTSRMIPGDVGTAGKEGNIYTIVTKEDENVAAAYRKIQVDLTRRITWGHTRLVIFGYEFAKEGIADTVDFFVRQPEFHLSTHIMVAPGKARDIANLTPAFERFPSEVLQEFVNLEVALPVRVLDYKKAYEYGANMIVPLLTIGEEPMLSEENQVSTWVGSGGGAIFHQGKLVGELSLKDMRGAMWFQRISREAVITAPSPTDNKDVSIIVLESKIKKRPVIENGDAIHFKLKIEAEDDLISSSSNIDFTNPAKLHELEQIFSEQLNTRIQEAFKKTQEVGADVFQIAQYLEWYYPKEWERLKHNWPEHYKDVVLDLQVTMKIKRPGAVINPPWVKTGEEKLID
ncbi:spore germination protein KC [Evansella caseinilytica]|uniref:Spore germination protein KC n=1 Tax=Evansella caseinilytica TaxID=1503961 RepID=A0A1H3H1T6_9BACI|nr:Ger(x)C family spore germination protein [Evansella caseinilytica]SDY09280.1 spore germination protein KC [Evansella caseinilytica]